MVPTNRKSSGRPRWTSKAAFRLEPRRRTQQDASNKVRKRSVLLDRFINWLTDLRNIVLAVLPIDARTRFRGY
jgi:hypothetical protein